MRWLLAALSFVLLVSLAVTTAATRAANLRMRVQLQEIEFGQVICSIECVRREQEVRPVLAPAELARRLRHLQKFERMLCLARLQ